MMKRWQLLWLLRRMNADRLQQHLQLVLFENRMHQVAYDKRAICQNKCSAVMHLTAQPRDDAG